MPAAAQDNTDRRFEVASVRRNVSGDTNMRVRLPPGRFEATNILIRDLIRMAHGLQSFQLVDGPEWLTTERYDIVGTPDRAYAPDTEGAPPEVIAMIPGIARLVVDGTGLTGTYDLDVQWNPDPGSQDVPGVFTAIQEQLGLRLQPERGAIDVFVIAAVTRPAEN